MTTLQFFASQVCRWILLDSWQASRLVPWKYGVEGLYLASFLSSHPAHLISPAEGRLTQPTVMGNQSPAYRASRVELTNKAITMGVNKCVKMYVCMSIYEYVNE